MTGRCKTVGLILTQDSDMTSPDKQNITEASFENKFEKIKLIYRKAEQFENCLRPVVKT